MPQADHEGAALAAAMPEAFEIIAPIARVMRFGVQTSIEAAIRFGGIDYPASIMIAYYNEHPDDAFEFVALRLADFDRRLEPAIFETLRGRRETLREIPIQYVIEGRVIDSFLHVDHHQSGVYILEKESRTIEIEIGKLIEETLREREEEALNL